MRRQIYLQNLSRGITCISVGESVDAHSCTNKYAVLFLQYRSIKKKIIIMIKRYSHLLFLTVIDIRIVMQLACYTHTRAHINMRSVAILRCIIRFMVYSWDCQSFFKFFSCLSYAYFLETNEIQYHYILCILIIQNSVNLRYKSHLTKNYTLKSSHSCQDEYKILKS